MEERKLTKADIDKVRHIEGFPIAKDEDIIALSRPPYYTACPNPFIEEFIRENGTPYDEATDDYHCEPFASDVSEGKNDPIYMAHSYHTKVPHKAIMRYILHYTKPGDIVFDGFCGTGMTGVAAQMCGCPDAETKAKIEQEMQGETIEWGARKAVLNDLSPAATKAVYNCVSFDEKIGIHYALMADYYQVFFDVADVFGHLLVYRDEVSATQVKAKIFEKWGQRSTLDTSLSKILKTFRDITAVSSPKRQSEYVCVKHKINDIHVLGLLLQALLKNSNQNYIGWDEFLSNPFMFPFEVCDLDESHIAALPFIELSRIDGRTVMSIKGYESTN